MTKDWKEFERARKEEMNLDTWQVFIGGEYESGWENCRPLQPSNSMCLRSPMDR